MVFFTSFEDVQKANIECEDSERNMWRERQNVVRCRWSMPAPRKCAEVAQFAVNKANAGT